MNLAETILQNAEKLIIPCLEAELKKLDIKKWIYHRELTSDGDYMTIPGVSGVVQFKRIESGFTVRGSSVMAVIPERAQPLVERAVENFIQKVKIEIAKSPSSPERVFIVTGRMLLPVPNTGFIAHNFEIGEFGARCAMSYDNDLNQVFYLDALLGVGRIALTMPAPQRSEHYDYLAAYLGPPIASITTGELLDLQRAMREKYRKVELRDATGKPYVTNDEATR